MRHFISIILFLFYFQVSAQTNSPVTPPLDKSQMDMSYYPVNYPILKIQDKVTEPLVMRVVYSRPQLNGRKVFGGLQEYGEVWRLGANEATEIEFFKEVTINNIKIRKGRYTFYAIPFPDKWIFILNRETDTWGSFRYDSVRDVVRINLPVQKHELTENMSITFEKSSSGADMNMYWEDVKVILPVVFK